MKKGYNLDRCDSDEKNIVLISKIYESFEALEETLGKLKLEEPLFITHVAKKSFADTIFNAVKKNNEKNRKSSKERLKN